MKKAMEVKTRKLVWYGVQGTGRCNHIYLGVPVQARQVNQTADEKDVDPVAVSCLSKVHGETCDFSGNGLHF